MDNALSTQSSVTVTAEFMLDAIMTKHLNIPTPAGSFDAIAAGPTDGRPVLLLHGFPQSALAWKHYVAELGDRGFHAVAPDARGYSPGVRPQQPEAYGMSDLVGDVLAIADALEWDRFDLVGHDWGGAVAWYTAAGHPERLRTLTVVSTPHPAAWEEAKRTDEDQQRRSQYQQDWRTPGTDSRMLANNAEFLRRVYQGKAPADHVEEYVRRLSEPGALNAALHYYRADRPDAEVGEIDVPTLYVWSTGDAAVGATAALATEKWVSGPYSFERLDEVTHWIPEEVPEVLTSLILNHLNGR